MNIVETYSPLMINGFKCYAPESASRGHDFPIEAFEHLYRSEEGSFWFRGRQRIIEYLVGRYVRQRPASFLEIGCGTGFVLKGLSKFKELDLMGAELHVEGLRWAKERAPHIEFIQVDAVRLPFRESFDAIGAFDVMEHIGGDEQVIRQVWNALKKNGMFFLTVPQHPWLWSGTDDRARHKRRYTRKTLRVQLEKAGFHVRFMSSFVAFLLPVMALSRFNTKHCRDDPTADGELHLPTWLDRLFELTLLFEALLIRCGFSLPIGGSLAVVAQK